jgi:PAS domain S-box-containing protein
MSAASGAFLELRINRYAMAVALVAAALLLRYLLVAKLGVDLPPFITFYPAIMIAAVLGGLGAGLLATALATLGTDLFILPPAGHFAIARPSDTIALGLFVAMGALMSILAENYRRSQRSIAAYRMEQIQRKSEEERHQVTEYAQLAIESAGLGTWEVRLETGEVSTDDCCRKLFGFTKDAGTDSRVFMENMHPEDRARVERSFNAAIARANGELWYEEYRVIWPDGSLHWLTSHGRAVFIGKGADRRASRLIGVAMDVTDEKKAELALRSSEHRYRRLFDSMDEGFCIIEVIFDAANTPVDYRFLEVNGAFERQTGLHNAVGKRMRELAPAHEERWFQTYGQIALTGKPAHFTDEAKALDRHFEVSAYRIGEPEMRLVAIVFHDISERVRTGEHIRRLNRVYSVLSEINQAIVREKSAQAMMEAACRIAIDKGGFRMAWIGMIDDGTQVLTPVASSGFIDGYLDGLRVNRSDPMHSGGPIVRCVVSGNDAICNDIENDPAYMPWRERALSRNYRSSAGFPLKVDDRIIGVFSLYSEEPGFFVGDELALLDEMAMDISYALEVIRREEIRRRQEEELRWRTAFFEAQVESSLDGILVLDGEGKKILQNQRMNELMKIPGEIAENPDIAPQYEFVTSIVRNADRFEEQASHLRSHPDEISRDEIELLNGTILDRYSSPVKDRSGAYYGRIWTFRDITAQRQLEEHFRQSQKMEAIGQLTGGIAHDFNNLLTVILGCSEFIGRELAANSQKARMNAMVVRAAQRGADLTHRMLAFARRQTLEPRQVDVNRLVVDMKSFLSRTLTAEIDLQVVPGSDDCQALVDPTQLESALLNLCVNARDAMPVGGTLTIETRHVVLDEDYAAQNPDVAAGSYIMVSVSDTGCGITPENLSRVFDPFFTTKGIGSGTGLGLSMVYGFVKQSQGHVKIYSELDRGTSVKLFLPQAIQQCDQPGKNETPLETLGGSELILVVEDDPAVRDLTKSRLIDLGYRVIESSNGKDALHIVSRQAEIDLLFTDLVMPGGMNGRELAEQACRLNRRLKVLYCSGYSEIVVSQGETDNVQPDLLQKPFTRIELARRIRKVLAKEL